MINYVAFLRGINVGGKRLIKMEELRRVVESIGLKNVRTFIASGNVIFETTTTDRAALAKKIEKKLLKEFGHEIPIALQTVDELKAVLKLNPFKKVKENDDVMLCVIFLAGKPKNKHKLPLRSETENLDVLAIENSVAFAVSRRKKNGMFCFPNNFFEKEFVVIATTRQWSTVNKVVAFAEANKR